MNLENLSDEQKAEIAREYLGTLDKPKPGRGKAKIRTREKCPKCGGRFEDTGSALICKLCLRIPKIYYLEFTWRKKQRKKYRNVRGKQLDTYRLAQAEARRVEERISDDCFFPLPAKTPRSNLAFNRYCKNWLERQKKLVDKGRLAPATYDSLESMSRLYLIPHFKHAKINRIKASDVEDFLINLPPHLSLHTQNQVMKILRKFFGDAHRRGDLKVIPGFPKLKWEKKEPPWLTNDKIEKIIKLLPQYCVDLFKFMQLQGVRPSEARALKMKSIDFERHTVTIEATFSNKVYRETTKTNKTRTIPLHPEIFEDLLKKRDEDRKEFVFLNHRGQPYPCASRLNKIWRRSAEKAGYGSNLYILRHSFASNALLRGVPGETIGKFLGHNSPQATSVYLHINQKGLQSCLAPVKPEDPVKGEPEKVIEYYEHFFEVKDLDQ